MHYVSAEDLTKSYGINPLFNNISFNINEGNKIAIVARNGYGKSTLLRILSGSETADSGKLWVNKDVTVALFEQEPVFDAERSVLDNIFNYSNPVLQAIKNYEAAAESNNTEMLNEALATMEELNAWSFEAKVKQVLSKLNIHHLNNNVGELSGGQRKRVALARTLVDIGFEHKHTLLIMDEPTNHLDIDMVEWLEHYLNKENLTLLLVTHDRYFLDNTCNEIWELDRSIVYTYKGNYENFLEKKAARIENEQAGIEKARNTYRRELEWMRKQPKARTTKSKSRIDAFEDVQQRAKQKLQDAQLQLQVKMSRLGGKIAEIKKVYKSYGDKTILKGFDYTFSKGERIGIIGKNGTGKSTFLNILQQKEKPDSGKINIGETVVFGYFSQQGLEIKDNLRVIEYVKIFAESFPLAKGGSLSAAQFLELFLFPGEKQYTFLASLSGGEKKRLQLLTILFRNPNFLILDEPTNDLDLPTLSVLENFLADFQGCLLIVSHDRYFMDRLADHLFVFEGNGIIKDFPGNYSQYREAEDEKETSFNIGEKPNKLIPVAEKKSIQNKYSYKEKRELELIEAAIPLLEEEKNNLTQQLSSGKLTYDEISSLSKRLEDITHELNEKETRWLQLEDK